MSRYIFNKTVFWYTFMFFKLDDESQAQIKRENFPFTPSLIQGRFSMIDLSTGLEGTRGQAALKLDNCGADSASKVIHPHPQGPDLCPGGWLLGNISLP